MSFLRSLLVWVLGFMLCSFMYFSVFSYGMVSFSSHDNLREIVGGIMEDSISEDNAENFESSHANMIEKCDSEGHELLYIPFEDGENITLTCNEIRESTPSELPGIFARSMFDKLYYKEFDCNFVSCLLSGQFEVVVSQKANEFFESTVYFFMIGTLISGILLYLSFESKIDFVKTLATCLVFVGLPFVFYGPLNSIMYNGASKELASTTGIILKSIFQPLFYLMVGVVIFGVILFLVSIYLKKKYKNG
jgi:hypothetical protein